MNVRCTWAIVALIVAISAAAQAQTVTVGTNIVRLTQTQIDALVNPETGFLVFNTTTNQLQLNSGTPASPVWESLTTSGGPTPTLAPVFMRQYGDVTNTSTSTWISLTDLTVPVDEFTTYTFEMFLPANDDGGIIGSDLEFRFTNIPAGATLTYGAEQNGDNELTTGGSSPGISVTGGGSFVHIMGILVTDATGGSLEPQFRRDNNFGSSVTVQDGAYIILTPQITGI